MKFLIDLSLELASVKTREQLQATLNGLLKEELHFCHSTVFLHNRSRTRAEDFFYDPAAVNVENPFCERAEISKAGGTLPYLKDISKPYEGMLFDLYEGDTEIGHWVLLYEPGRLPKAEGKPLMTLIANQLSIVVSKMITCDAGLAEKVSQKKKIDRPYHYPEIINGAPVMERIFRLIAQVAPSGSTALVLGETGTGKELIARAIHNASPRNGKSMITVNCAALPANLIESELFGHERGSFTGAMERRVGKFELANNGTIFLDEIGEMPLELQVKLLRVLQEREIERIGGRTTIKLDVRIIAATNRDLKKEMEEGRFRRDLYYRLNVFPIFLPPLRDRREDIPDLAAHFVQVFSKKTGKDIKFLDNSAMKQLMQYSWPGNVRELEHLIERAVLEATGDTIEQIHLPPPEKYSDPSSYKEFFVPKTIHENEREFILKTIRYCHGTISGEGGAAQILGVPRSTLNSKMKRLGIRKEHIG